MEDCPYATYVHMPLEELIIHFLLANASLNKLSSTLVPSSSSFFVHALFTLVDVTSFHSLVASYHFYS